MSTKGEESDDYDASVSTMDTESTVSELELGDPDELLEKILQEVRELVPKITEHHENPTKAFYPLHAIRQLFFRRSAKPFRKQIGDVLSECGYPKCTYNMLKGLQKRGYYPRGLDIFKHLSMWKTSRHILDNAWNYSDSSDKFAEDLANENVLEIMCLNLVDFPADEIDTNRDKRFIIKATLSIMRNVALRPETKTKFKDCGAFNPVSRFMTCKDSFINVLALSTMALIADEKQAKNITENEKTIGEMLHLMSIAVEHDNIHRIKEGLTAAELATCVEKLAVDGNVEALINANVLKVLYRMLRQKPDMKQKVNAAMCIWTLANDKSARVAIQKETKLLDWMEAMKKTETDEDLLHNLRMALGVLCELDQREQLPIVTSSKPQHVLISYHQTDSETVAKIYTRLTEEGFIVVPDIERMQGTVIDALASNIENSSIIILCVSESLKQNRQNRTTANYAFSRQKKFIPLYMQNPYQPDGWLGYVSRGYRVYIDFSSLESNEFEKNMDLFLGELRTQVVLPIEGFDGTNSVPASAIQSPTDSIKDVFNAPLLREPCPRTTYIQHTKSPNLSLRIPSPSTHASASPVVSTAVDVIVDEKITRRPPAPEIPPELSNMDSQDVGKWLNQHDLDSCVNKLKDVNGKMLWQLKIMKSDCLKLYCSTLREDYKLDANELLIFGSVLDTNFN